MRVYISKKEYALLEEMIANDLHIPRHDKLGDEKMKLVTKLLGICEQTSKNVKRTQKISDKGERLIRL